jgi:uncharacterized SAM-binding protein YcdF (DUF218 family)
MVNDGIGWSCLTTRPVRDRPYDRRVLRRTFGTGGVVVVVLLVVVAATGHYLFANTPDDPKGHVDAVVVLGGEHDGREAYGLELAQRVGARSVLLSNSYSAHDPIMRRLCGSRQRGIDVICRAPEPKNTRGEALMAKEIGREQGWDSIAVVTWRFHMLRARIIFEECYSPESDRISMQSVPIAYNLPIAMWEYIYLYQYVALAKNFLQGSCS